MTAPFLSLANRLKLAHKALVLIAVPLVFELGFVAMLLNLQHEMELEVARETHAREVTDTVNSMLFNLYALFAVVGKGESLPEIPLNHYSGRTISSDLERLRVLTTSTECAQQVEGIQAEVSSWAEQINRLRTLVKIAPAELSHEFAAIYPNYKERVSALAAKLNDVVTAEKSVEVESPKVQARIRQRIRFVLYLAIPFNVLLAIGLAYYFNKTTVDRLSTVMRNTRALAANEPLAAPVDGNDEIAMLDHAFHETVGERRKIDRMKQDFINMVSHDLRTPLTSLKAVIEMLRDGAYGEINDVGQTILSRTSGSVNRLINAKSGSMRLLITLLHH